MAYSLHIEREEEIELQEWIDTVEGTSGVKIDNSSNEIVNPNTGERISFGESTGDVAVLFETKGILGFGKKKEWVKAIRFSNGKASFNARAEIEDPNNPVRLAASQLANSLQAKVVGDEGEVYEW